MTLTIQQHGKVKGWCRRCYAQPVAVWVCVWDSDYPTPGGGPWACLCTGCVSAEIVATHKIPSTTVIDERALPAYSGAEILQAAAAARAARNV